MSRYCASCRFAEPSKLDDWVDEDRANLSDSEKRAVAFAERFPFACLRSRMSGGEPEDPETLAFTMDGSEYRGELLVSANYGCVMYEAKSPDSPEGTSHV